MTDLLTGNYLDELRAEYARTVTPLVAAQLIYRASGSPINPGRFYDTNADALDDMRKRAGADTAESLT